jgi:DNA polymerase
MKFTTEEAYDVVNTYRTTYPGVPLLWKKLEVKLASTLNPTYDEHWHGLFFDNNKIQLPNGLSLHYNNLRFEDGNLTYDSNKTETTWGGRIAENAVQALSRIVISDAMLSIQRDPDIDVDIALTVHDEIVIIGEANNPDATMSKLIEHMCVPPSWAPDLPLDAEGGYDVRYSK